MKKLINIWIACACLLPVVAQAQVNYVLNGGFEQYNSCPTDLDQIRKARYWMELDTTIAMPYCSAEFCHICAGTNGFIGVPYTVYYYHYPRSGGGMVSMEMYINASVTVESHQRDNIQGRLVDHLIAGRSYCVTFYVTREQICQLACNKMGAYLDDGSINIGQDSLSCGHVQTSVTPQVYSTAIIEDTVNWVKVQGSFVANGTERFITLGNFFANDNTDTIGYYPHLGAGVYYLLDDVSVIESNAVADAGGDALVGLGDTVHIGTYEDGMPCEWYVLGSTTPIGYGGGIGVSPVATTSYVVRMDLCGHITYDTVRVEVVPAGVSGLILGDGLVSVYPNPAANVLHIDHAAQCVAGITDITGRIVWQGTLADDKAVVDVSGLTPGLYMVQLADAASGRRVVRMFSRF